MLTDLKCLSLVFLSLEAFALASLLLLDLEQKGTFFVVGAILVRLGCPYFKGLVTQIPFSIRFLQYPRLVIPPWNSPIRGAVCLNSNPVYHLYYKEQQQPTK